MKSLVKIMVLVLGIVLVILLACAILIRAYGKRILIDQVRQNLGIEASLESIGLKFPVTVELKKLKLGEFASFEKISLTPNLLGFFAGKIVLADVTLENPDIRLTKTSDGRIILPKFKTGGKPPQVFITGLQVKKGKFTFNDESVSPQGLQTVLNNIDCSVSKVMLPPTSLKTNLELSAFLENGEGKILGKLSAKGWIDFGPKDMDVDCVVQDLDPVYFAPYYGDFLSAKKLLSAKLNLTFAFKAKDDDLTMNTDFNLSQLVYAKEEPAQEGALPQLNLMKNALDLFTDENGNLHLSFALNTKLDRPALSAEQLKRVILDAAARNLANQHPEQLMNKIQNTIDQFKDFGKEMKKIFKNKD